MEKEKEKHHNTDRRAGGAQRADQRAPPLRRGRAYKRRLMEI
ncbi:hypothetical protein [Cloacibacillus porcorum]|nr:hypothetical protein [Cloacibacillus porcorum]